MEELIIMDVGEIIRDSLKYPLSDWKKILILGILLVISNFYAILNFGNWVLTLFLGLFGVIVGMLIYGYFIRIIEASIADISELPNFDEWKNMFIDGLKMFIIVLIYIIPLILILIVAAITSSSNTMFTVVLYLISLLYLICIGPMLAMGLANMAYNNQMSKAFKFGEIIEKIRNIGWWNFLSWYIVVVVLLIILLIMAVILDLILGLINSTFGSIMISLLVIPYIYMFLGRSIALEYISDKKTP